MKIIIFGIGRLKRLHQGFYDAALKHLPIEAARDNT